MWWKKNTIYYTFIIMLNVRLSRNINSSFEMCLMFNFNYFIGNACWTFFWHLDNSHCVFRSVYSGRDSKDRAQ